MADTQAALRNRRKSLRHHIDKLVEIALIAENEDLNVATMSYIAKNVSSIGLPTLTEDNLAVWLFAIRSIAEEYDIRMHIDQNVPTPSEDAVRKLASKQKAQADRLIITSISNDIFRELGDDFMLLTPHEMISKIELHLATSSSPEEHERLFRKAQDLKIRRRETTEQYIKRYRLLRTTMTRAHYPNIADEHTSVMFAVRGLSLRPSLARHVPLLSMQNLPSLNALKNALDCWGV